MKIFALSRTYGHKAGYEKSFIHYLRAFRKLSHEVTVFYEQEGLMPADLDFPKHQIAELCIGRKNGKFSYRVPPEFQKMVAEQKPDLIFLNHVEHAGLMEWLASLENCRIIRRLALHDLYCLNGNKVLPNADQQCSFAFGWRCALNAYLNHCDARQPDRLLGHFNFVRRNLHATRKIQRVVVPSQYMKNVLMYNGVAPEKIVCIPPYCDVSNQVSEDGRYILFVGRVARIKGLDWLLQALGLLPDSLKLLVVGEGPSVEESKALAEKLDLNGRVEFKGFGSPEEVREYERRCSFLVVPSVWEEPAGIVCIEAMAAGKPVIAFDVGGISDYVQDGVNGFLVPRKDVRTLAARIATLMKDERLRKRMGEASLKIVRKELGGPQFEARVSSLLAETAQ